VFGVSIITQIETSLKTGEVVLCETWTLWNDRKLADPLDARFLQGGPQAGLTHSTFGSQATFAILTTTPLLEPSVDLALAGKLPARIVHGPAFADPLRVGHRPLLLLFNPLLGPIVPGLVVVGVSLADREPLYLGPRGDLGVHLGPFH